MRKREFFKVAIALCLALVLFACEVNPGGGAGGPNGNNGASGNNNTGGPGGNGGDKSYTIKINVLEIGETFVSLKWNAVVGVKRYSVSINNDRFDRGAYYRDYIGEATEHTIKELIPGETYNIIVAEQIPIGSKVVNVSKLIPVTTLPPSLSTPQNLKAEPTAHSVKITWDQVSGAESYKIFWLANDTWRHSYSTVSKLLFNDLGRGRRTREFSYKIYALSADGKRASTFSEVVHAKLDPETLVLPKITLDARSYEIKWSWPSLAKDEVMLYESYTNEKMSIRIGPLEVEGGKNDLVFSNPPQGEEYFYHFRLINKITGEASPYGELFTLTTPLPELKGAPANLEVVSIKEAPYSPGYYNIEIRWDGVEGAEKYYLFSDSYGHGYFYKEKETAATTITLSYVRLSDTPVVYKVKAINLTDQKASALSLPLTVDKSKLTM